MGLEVECVRVVGSTPGPPCLRLRKKKVPGLWWANENTVRVLHLLRVKHGVKTDCVNPKKKRLIHQEG